MSELYHYGVLGMKWGMRRARKKGTNYEYRSLERRVEDRRLSKAIKSGDANKIAKANEYRNAVIERDKKRVDYAKSTSVGKTIVKNLLMGPTGAEAYNVHRSQGESRAVSTGMAILSEFGILGTAVNKFYDTRNIYK